MTGCPDYKPDPVRYQQLVPFYPTSGFDCTAWVGAFLADIDSCGTEKITGRQVRQESSEPMPDPDSPGLNFPQVDAAVYRVTKGRVNLTLGGTWTPRMSTGTATTWALNGRPLGVQINRGVLIDLEPGLGAVNGFRGGHAIGVKAMKGLPWVFDPLVRIYVPVAWSHLWRAASSLAHSGLSAGYANVLAARDIVPSSYWVRLKAKVPFTRYHVEGGVITKVKGDELKTATARVCTRRESIYFPAFKGYRNVVRLIKSGDAAYPYVSTDSAAVTYTEVLP